MTQNAIVLVPDSKDHVAEFPSALSTIAPNVDAALLIQRISRDVTAAGLDIPEKIAKFPSVLPVIAPTVVDAQLTRTINRSAIVQEQDMGVVDVPMFFVVLDFVKTTVTVIWMELDSLFVRVRIPGIQVIVVRVRFVHVVIVYTVVFVP